MAYHKTKLLLSSLNSDSGSIATVVAYGAVLK